VTERRVAAHGEAFLVVDDPRHARLWARLESGAWEPDTFAAMRLCLTAASLHLDLGAWIGPTVLYAAGLAGRIVAVEPDPVAMAALIANLALNPARADRVLPVAAAVAAESGPLDLYAKEFGESLTSRFPVAKARRLTAYALGADDLLDRVIGEAAHVLVKVDVEGAEYDLVPALLTGLARRGLAVDLLLSLHGSLLAEADRPGPEALADFEAALRGFGTAHGWIEGAWRPLPAPPPAIGYETVLIRRPATAA
jgi:FkbM family methyltransferase